VFDEHGQDPRLPPDLFIADINGYTVEVRRVSSQEANQEEKHSVARQEHNDSEQSQENRQSMDSDTRRRHASGYLGSLSPLEETDTASVETSRSPRKQETQNREQQAVQDFYNNYRNPLARLRARFPEAPAEFIAVSINYNRIM
jgi:aquaglyceroporin related protein